MQYLTTENAKTSKGESMGYLTGILYLAPSDESGKINVCPHASIGCRDACLFFQGRGQFDSVKSGRIRKTLEFAKNPKAFVEALALDIEALIRKAKREGLTPCIRLNGTSDLPWEKLGGEIGVSLMNRFPTVSFYDYTKNPARALAFARGEMPANYTIVFSRSECNGATALSLLEQGVNVAAVFATKKGDKLPKTWGGRPVIDGDLTDLRFLDARGRVVGLRAKGTSRKDESGFVIPV